MDDTFLLTIWKSPGKSVEQDGGVPVAVCAETVATKARRATAYCIVVRSTMGIVIRGQGVIMRQAAKQER